MSEPASPNAQRPKPKRSITFANITTRNNAASRRPDVPRSISFAHPQQQQDRRRPGAPPRALSFCDTRFTPSGPNLALRQGSVSGPLAFLNPTTAIFDICADDDGLPSEATDPEHGGERARVRWNAREFRKGRHVFVLPRAAPLAHRLRTTSRPRRVLLGLLRMATVFPYWDVSWLIGVCFTVGCALFIACGFFYWLPVAYPATAFAHEADVAGGVVAFVGATLFQVGAVLLMLEAWNDRAETKFGGAMETLLADRRFGLRRGGDKEEEEVTRPENGGAPRDTTPRRQPNPFGEREWQWLPSWHDVRTHYVYEIGFLASATMALGAGRDRLLPAKWGAYYLPYLVGGILFALASVLYVLETQPNWYTPQPCKMGWHVGVFNLLGGVGWTLAAAFGYCDVHWCRYQSELALIWASIAFTFGSALQWYEALDKYVFVIED
ncbi:integral membrane protein [Cordyceps militaris CM01]|uniref:Integral membrane protein n=1 Tax=Cordyceps militaris (strain CM01) TaxID=983644 RepID=G3JC82_CORMM|nr:uncharacterized protein CCM_02016 [Cordyceps militaris CM01]EGX93747.1 integral membrane protein [Cordyceps militaris CM01]